MQDAEERVTYLRPKQEMVSPVDLDLLRESLRKQSGSSQWTPHEASLAPPCASSTHSEDKQPPPPPRSLVGKLASTARAPLRVSNVGPTRQNHNNNSTVNNINSKAVSGAPIGEMFVQEQRQQYVPSSPSSEHGHFRLQELGTEKPLHKSPLVDPLSHATRPVKLPPQQSPSSSSTSSEPFPDIKPSIASVHQSKQRTSSTSIFKTSVPLPYPAAKDEPHSPELASIYKKSDWKNRVSVETLVQKPAKVANNDPTINHLPSLIGAQPPLPSVPPPTSARFTASGAPSAGKRANATSAHPPLPPGPPPPSSFVRDENPLSSLLSTLVAKGLISSPSMAQQTPVPNQNQTDGAGPVKPEPVELKPVMQEVNLIGYEFKPEVMREYHPKVIDSLFDEMSHQCQKCGLRFELKDQLESHLEWHESDKPCTSRYQNSLGVSRKWYADSGKWVIGSFGTETDQQVEPTNSLTDDGWLEEERSGPMVPADERQILCVLCGDPFGDVYCFDREEWMYRDTVYLDMPCSVEGGIIVHDKCAAIS